MTTTTIPIQILAGERVALVGRLASMTRREAVALVGQLGGQFTRSVSREATLLVVGCGGWPLSPDGRVPRKLRVAHRLVESGRALVILNEHDFLERVGGQRPAACYSLAELSQILGVAGQRLRSWVRAGLIRPQRVDSTVSYFDYAQAARAKSLSDLLEAGIRPSRLRQSLTRLQQWVGDGEEGGSQLAILERFGQVVVRLENGSLADPSGQLRFEFSEDHLFADHELAVCAFPEETATAEDWFARGLEHDEQCNFAEAVAAYRKCLTLGGPAADPCFNLAGALYALGKRSAAAERFRQVIELEPGFSEAWNNLGTILIELGEADEALSAFGRAIQIDPDFADAHFNFADALEDEGRLIEAREHWQAYLRYETDGQWADYARRKLASDGPSGTRSKIKTKKASRSGPPR